jgi:hypothetical protein
MTCTPLVIDGKAVGIVCTRGQRRAKTPCQWCTKLHEYLCDHRARPKGRRCSKKLCADHAHQVGDDEHMCPDHAPRDIKPENRSPLQLHTGNCNRHRKDPDAFDVTVMTGGPDGKPFAPSVIIFNAARKAKTEVTILENTARIEELAGRHESAATMRLRAAYTKRTSWETYRRAFFAEMLVSSGSPVPKGWERDVDDARSRGVECHRDAWDRLLQRKRVVLLCYCDGRECCHRGLLVDILVRKGAKDCGELDSLKDDRQVVLEFAKCADGQFARMS